jgi:hypothetical protein
VISPMAIAPSERGWDVGPAPGKASGNVGEVRPTNHGNLTPTLSTTMQARRGRAEDGRQPVSDRADSRRAPNGAWEAGLVMVREPTIRTKS